jgi:hypothetical protein
MKEFSATLHTYLGHKHEVVVQVDRQADFVNTTTNVSGEKTTFTMGDWEVFYLSKLKNGSYCSDDFYASCSVYDGKENHRLSITANKYSCAGLWMAWEESWQDGLVRKSSTFILSMDDPEATEFLQYIIEGFDK